MKNCTFSIGPFCNMKMVCYLWCRCIWLSRVQIDDTFRFAQSLSNIHVCLLHFMQFLSLSPSFSIHLAHPLIFYQTVSYFYFSSIRKSSDIPMDECNVQVSNRFFCISTVFSIHWFSMIVDICKKKRVTCFKVSTWFEFNGLCLFWKICVVVAGDDDDDDDHRKRTNCTLGSGVALNGIAWICVSRTQTYLIALLHSHGINIYLWTGSHSNVIRVLIYLCVLWLWLKIYISFNYFLLFCCVFHTLIFFLHFSQICFVFFFLFSFFSTLAGNSWLSCFNRELNSIL